MEVRTPKLIKIKYLNVQHWTNDKHAALTAHLTINNPDILFTFTSRTKEQGPIKIPFYNTFSTNKTNEQHAGCGIAIRKGIIFELLNNFHHDTIGAKINTQQGPIILMTSYAPPRQQFLPNQDLEYMMHHQTPVLFAGDLNARHSTFGYPRGANAKGRSLHRHIMSNRINYIGPTFPTFYTRNSETKPDCVLTNQHFYLNHHIQSAGIGPSDHLTIDIIISTEAITVQCTPILDENNANWEEYKNQLSADPEINLDGGNTADIHHEFDKILNSILAAKESVTPIRTTIRKNNLKTTAKFRRLTKILDKYHNALITHGKTAHLEKIIRSTQLMLIQEGNVCKEEWWQTQIEKIEMAAKSNIKFWKRINHF
ncbi:unnamed protein product, partial [Meganyctiphanes norvegica]